MFIPVSPKKEDLYKAYITCLNPVLKLKPREIETLDILARTYLSLRSAVKKGQVNAADIYPKMYSDVGRKIMQDAIKMSPASFTNHVCQLRKKKILTENNELPSYITELETLKEPLVVKYTIESPKA